MPHRLRNVAVRTLRTCVDTLRSWYETVRITVGAPANHCNAASVLFHKVNAVSTLFQRCFNAVSTLFQRCFNAVSTLFQR